MTALSTSQMRAAWSPACQYRNASGTRSAYKALDQSFHHFRYAPRGGGVCGGANCRPITGGTGYSIHSYDFGDAFTFWTGVAVKMAAAVDINSDKNPYGSRLVTDMGRIMINAIEGIRTKSGHQVWVWGGDWNGDDVRNESVYDAMHFQLGCSPAHLATGINWNTVPGSTPPAAAPAYPEGTPTVTIELTLPVLRIGAKGEAVRVLQQHLVDDFEQTVKVDGGFGASTETAVNNVKKFFGLEDDGIVGDKVWELILTLAFWPKVVTDG